MAQLFDATQYLARIGIYDVVPGRELPDLALLQRLLDAHLWSVPFENIDIMRRKPLSLNEDDLYSKIVIHNRGGFCYELNGLFAMLLRALGYKVDTLSGRVRRGDGSYGTPDEHLTTVVHLDQPYLAEVGFAKSFPRVMSLDGTPYVHPKGTYRVRRDGEEYFVEAERKGEWVPEFRFDPTPRQLHEFNEICAYIEGIPSFNSKYFCIVGKPEETIELKEHELIRRSGTEVSRTAVHSMEEFWGYMHELCEPFRRIAESLEAEG
ncbi:MAG: arylamine N-acetyltransferase [Bacteroidota bacterium]|nr:arylamine N-acetyltransferase [Bacteroidota bacterium]MDP4234176.1 arylamine N-acetyltransferase [Bacteroidota bacterium]MDP4243758.1 arylamine N-acetyltransferase [Bacteroidota bacterium]MDP4287877.1 arylamine N-acetyltransferase [Bacteroidota bacterium]